MTKKDIDVIVWWVPFSRTRNALRNILNTIANIEKLLFDKKKLDCDVDDNQTSMTLNMSTNELLEKAYQLDNFLIYDDEKATKNVAVIYFSSNGIYYPNYSQELENKIFIKNSFEYYKTRIKNAKRHIFIRDILKQFYVLGINDNINSIDKLLEFIKENTKGMDLITVGSSSGGYMSLLVGILLNAKQIFTFSPIINIYEALKTEEHFKGYCYLYQNKDDDKYSKYYNIVNMINDTNIDIIYVYPNLSQLDLNQKRFISSEKENIIFIQINSEEHGANFERKTLLGLLNSSSKFLKLISKIKSTSIFQKILKKKYTRWI